MASDRAFGPIGKKWRKHDSIFLPNQYKEIFSKSGKTLLLGEDFNLYNFKELFKNISGKIQKLKISQIRRVYCIEGIFNYSYNYTSDYVSVNLKEDFANLPLVESVTMAISNKIKDEKINDIKKLLTKNGHKEGTKIGDFYNSLNK